MFVRVCVYNKMSLPPPVCSLPYVTSAHIVPAPACRNAWNRAKSLLEMHVNPGPDHPQVQPGNLQLLSQNRAQRETIAPNTHAHMYRPLKSRPSTAAVIISIKCKRCMSSGGQWTVSPKNFLEKESLIVLKLHIHGHMSSSWGAQAKQKTWKLKAKVINHISLHWSNFWSKT